MHLRPARPGDIPALQEIEVAAGRLFLDVGLAEIAGDAPLPAAELLSYQGAGRAWVAADDADEPAAY